jgi:ubiquinone/menaquinone biosynthesis C-methylase UbiE
VNALLAGIGPEAIVLDYGAGRGNYVEDPVEFRRDLRALRGKVSRVIGIDLDEVVLENETVDEAFIISNGEPLPFEDESVHLIVSDFTFEHIADPAWTTTELDRVLRPGGWICARTPNRRGYIGLGARFVPNGLHVRFLRRLQPSKKPEDTFPTTYLLNTPKALKHWFPPERFDHLSYSADSEPAYFGKWVTATRIARAGLAIIPSRWRSIHFIFLRKVGEL